MKHWYFLTMLSLVALLSYATNLPWWQATLLGALLNMWAWTLLSPRLVNDSKKDGGIKPGQLALHGAANQDGRQWNTGVTADEDNEDLGISPTPHDSNSSANQVNPANGLPMLN